MNKVIKSVISLVVLFVSLTVNAQKIIHINQGLYSFGEIDTSDKLNTEQFEDYAKKLEWMPFSNFKMPKKKSSTLWIKTSVPLINNQKQLVYLQRVDHNIEVYCDGKLIYRFGDESKTLTFSGSPPHKFYLPNDRLSETVYFKITSLQNTIGLYGFAVAGNEKDINRYLSRYNFYYYVQGLFTLFAGLSLILFFVFFKRDAIYLYFGAVSVFLSVFILFRSRIVYPIFEPGSELLLYYIFTLSAYLFTPFLFAYISTITQVYRKGQIFIIILYSLYAIVMPIAAYMQLYPVYFSFKIYSMAVLPGATFFLMIIFKQIKTGDKAFRIMVFGAFVFIFLGLFDLLSHFFNIGVKINLINAGFIVMLLCNIYILVQRLSDIQKQIKSFHNNLVIAYNKISLSEKKYRIIVESSNELIFTMDSDYRILSMNREMKKNSGSLLKSDIYFDSILYQESEQDIMAKDIIKERLDMMVNNCEPISVRIQMHSNLDTEPVDAVLNCQLIKFGDKKEILGRIVKVTKDVLVKYFEQEMQVYRIPNLISLVEDLTHRITRNLEKFLTQREINIIRIGLREVIVNSIEHGNLNISFEEKADALKNNSYYSLLLERQKVKEYKDTFVNIKYRITGEKAEYWIEDTGTGFVHKKYLNSSNKEELFNGRGIKMMREIFDMVEYNETGNSVYLVKKMALNNQN